MTTGPSKEFVTRCLTLSQEFLDDAHLLLEQGRARSCVDRAYYAMYYAATALLCQRGIRPPRSHGGLVNVFGREIVNRGVIDGEYGRILAAALRSRLRSTYSSGAEVVVDDARREVSNAERFVLQVSSALNG